MTAAEAATSSGSACPTAHQLTTPAAYRVYRRRLCFPPAWAWRTRENL